VLGLVALIIFISAMLLGRRNLIEFLKPSRPGSILLDTDRLIYDPGRWIVCCYRKSTWTRKSPTFYGILGEPVTIPRNELLGFALEHVNGEDLLFCLRHDGQNEMGHQLPGAEKRRLFAILQSWGDPARQTMIECQIQ